MTKRCVTRSGQDISVDVRMSVISVGGQPFISCLADFHGPHTWELPVSGAAGGAIPGGAVQIKSEDLGLVTLGTPGFPVQPVASQHAPEAGGRRRVPLPRDAVQELRNMLAVTRYPDPKVREEFSVRRGIDRKRVDRWLENARARETAKMSRQGGLQ